MLVCGGGMSAAEFVGKRAWKAARRSQMALDEGAHGDSEERLLRKLSQAVDTGRHSR